MNKIAIVCTAFGTARASALAPFQAIVEKIRAQFSPELVEFAFSSGFVRKNLAQSEVFIDSPVEAVSKRLAEGFTVIVQPFQIVAGGEYEKTVAEIADLPGTERCFFGDPLMRNESDATVIAHCIVDRKKLLFPACESIIAAGHGNGNHPTDKLYVSLDMILRSIDSRFCCATLETEPVIDPTIASLVKLGVQSTVVMPVLFSAGKHVSEDLAGESDHSWNRKLQNAGIEPTVDLIPLGEQEPYLALWIERLRQVYEKVTAAQN